MVAGVGQGVGQVVAEVDDARTAALALAQRLQALVLAAQLAQCHAQVGPAGGRFGMLLEEGSVGVDGGVELAVGMKLNRAVDGAARFSFRIYWYTAVTPVRPDPSPWTMPDRYVAVWVPVVPIRIAPLSEASPRFPM